MVSQHSSPTRLPAVTMVVIALRFMAALSGAVLHKYSIVGDVRARRPDHTGETPVPHTRCKLSLNFTSAIFPRLNFELLHGRIAATPFR